MARPSIFTPELAATICERLADKESWLAFDRPRSRVRALPSTATDSTELQDGAHEREVPSQQSMTETEFAGTNGGRTRAQTQPTFSSLVRLPTRTSGMAVSRGSVSAFLRRKR